MCIRDRGQIDIVLVNVMVNAVQAAAGRPEPWVRVSSRADGERATVSITDNGPGVPREICGKIFDPFFTTKARWCWWKPGATCAA